MLINDKFKWDKSLIIFEKRKWNANVKAKTFRKI
jgi:hypothetical protein